jgi:hypothetical protein
MGVRDVTYILVKLGFSPGLISTVRKVSLETTLGYLDQMIGQGRLRRSDVFFSVGKDVRKKCAGAVTCPDGVSHADFAVLHRYGDAAHALGDMYEDLRCIEMSLHATVRDTLVQRFGDDEFGWWRQGVPETIRKTCQVRREEDAEPASSPFCYTDLLDLGRIIEVHWTLFEARLPDRYRPNRKMLFAELRRLNSIRRDVMHPVRGNTPSEDDFEFTRRLKMDFVPESLNAKDEAEFQQMKDTILAAIDRAKEQGGA